MLFGITASAIKTVPDAPIITNVTDVGTGRAYNNGAATVTFTAPSYTGKLPIGSYTVKAYNSSGSYMGISASGASSPIIITGLASNTVYKYTVTAANTIGSSIESSFSPTVTATTVPQAPTIGTASDGGTGTTASVLFSANANGGKTVTTYTATSSPGSLTGTTSSPAAPITVSGLTTGTAYTFTVTATNANGTSTASSASNSVTPINPSSYESIATVTGNGSSNTITFSSIPSTYKHLQIRAVAKDTYNSANTTTNIMFNFNSDNGSNYSWHKMAGYGSGTLASGNGNLTSIFCNDAIPSTGSYMGDTHAVVLVDIMDYANTSKYTTVKGSASYDTNRSTGVVGYINLFSGSWRNTAAVSSITITGPNTAWSTTTQFALYGIKG